MRIEWGADERLFIAETRAKDRYLRSTLRIRSASFRTVSNNFHRRRIDARTSVVPVSPKPINPREFRWEDGRELREK